MRKAAKWSNLATVAMVAIGLSALAEEGKNIKTVPMTDLPAVVQTALGNAANGATIEQIVLGHSYYVLKLTLDGALQTVTVSADGKACEGPGKLTGKEKITGSQIQWADLPEAVRNTVSMKFAGAPINEVLRGTMVYTAVLKKDDVQSVIRVTEDGKILRRPPERELKVRQAREQEFFNEAQQRPGRGGGGPVSDPPRRERRAPEKESTPER